MLLGNYFTCKNCNVAHKVDLDPQIVEVQCGDCGYTISVFYNAEGKVEGVKEKRSGHAI